ncbi:MAG TPA: HNH endonuclease signature motif containing protein [Usitatibacter sp.]|nr:HNH endonuclease signature motif containing protein [Usitatibacter sp.]
MSLRSRRPIAERFWKKVDKNGPIEPGMSTRCWLWTASRDRDGYGFFYLPRGSARLLRAHRVAYELVVGPIPDGLTLDHLCRAPACVNPAHLDPCTMGENVRRSPLAIFNARAEQTHCTRGHPFDEKNTGIHSGRRMCRACRNLMRRSLRARRAV